MRSHVVAACLPNPATLGPKMKALSGPEVNDAADHIARDAQVSCGIALKAS